MFLAKSDRVEVASIIIPEDRQRKDFDKDELKTLAKSIERRGGLIQPIVVTKDLVLIAGHRRLLAHKLLGLDKIDVRYNNTLDPTERSIIELEENLKRVDLSWQERCQAIKKLHANYMAAEEDWNAERTAEAIGMQASAVSKFLGLANEIDAGNKAVIQAEKMSHAVTSLRRTKKKEIDQLSNTLFNDIKKPKDKEEDSKPEPPRSVICADFIEWSKSYEGEKFSFMHCDLPYGVNMDKSGQVSQSLGLYEDSEDTYFKLLDAFTSNYFRFATHVSHIMFWFSMKYYERTRVKLETIKGARVFPYPLIWHKSDGRGMMPDMMREGRRTYETAFLVSVNDRTILKPVANSFACPLDETRAHQAAKPKPMLEHFFQMFVEPGVRVLDPTCGSGNALVVARSLGAEVLGIELDQGFVDRIRL